MKKKIICIVLAAAMCVSAFTGCGKKKEQAKEQKELTPDDMSPDYYTSEEEIPTGTYCIAHKMGETKDSINVRYYPLYNAESFGSPDDGATGSDGSRYFWLNYNVDEGKLPTMYPGDRIVYKSDTSIPDHYIIEKFFDYNYTVGMAGIYDSSLGKPAINLNEDGCNICNTSDARVLQKIEPKNNSDDTTSEIVVNTMNDKDVTDDDLNLAGMISGLEEGKTYNFDFRLGTKSYPVTLKANIHAFVLGETYKSKSYDYVTDSIIRVNLPDFLTTGYYEINGAGAFRFLKTEKDYKNLTAADYNDFIYTYSGSYPTGSVDGKVLNDDGYLVDYEEYINQMADDDAKSYEEDTDDGDDDSYDEDDSQAESSDASGDNSTRMSSPDKAGGTQSKSTTKSSGSSSDTKLDTKVSTSSDTSASDADTSDTDTSTSDDVEDAGSIEN